MSQLKRKKCRSRAYRSSLNLHHIYPSSRVVGGKVVLIPITFHEAWHRVFGNLYGLECYNFLRALFFEMNSTESINNNRLEQMRINYKCYPEVTSMSELNKIKDSIRTKK